MFRFSWDLKKAASNLVKHDVSFKEASTVFGDYLAKTAADPDHSIEEDRQIIFGYSERQRLLAVIFRENATDIRIISARVATKAERKFYEQR